MALQFSSARMSGGPLSKDGLAAIKNHKYKGGEYTPIDLILNHFWAASTEYLPMWMAPNIVTLLGVAHHLVVYCGEFFPPLSLVSPKITAL
jgi:ethanolaminephosphotransferase